MGGGAAGQEALPLGTTLCWAGAGLGPLSSADCPSACEHAGLWACKHASSGREQAATSPTPRARGRKCAGEIAVGAGGPPAGQSFRMGMERWSDVSVCWLQGVWGPDPSTGPKDCCGRYSQPRTRWTGSPESWSAPGPL